MWIFDLSGKIAQKTAINISLKIALQKKFRRKLAKMFKNTDHNIGPSADVLIQWDPDHGPDGSRQIRRAIQIGLRGANCSSDKLGRFILIKTFLCKSLAVQVS
jgi:hypothetical protein